MQRGIKGKMNEVEYKSLIAGINSVGNSTYAELGVGNIRVILGRQCSLYKSHRNVQFLERIPTDYWWAYNGKHALGLIAKPEDEVAGSVVNIGGVLYSAKWVGGEIPTYLAKDLLARFQKWLRVTWDKPLIPVWAHIPTVAKWWERKPVFKLALDPQEEEDPVVKSSMDNLVKVTPAPNIDLAGVCGFAGYGVMIDTPYQADIEGKPVNPPIGYFGERFYWLVKCPVTTQLVFPDWDDQPISLEAGNYWVSAKAS